MLSSFWADPSSVGCTWSVRKVGETCSIYLGWDTQRNSSDHVHIYYREILSLVIHWTFD